jgi:hypothetical protein
MPAGIFFRKRPAVRVNRAISRVSRRGISTAQQAANERQPLPGRCGDECPGARPLCARVSWQRPTRRPPTKWPGRAGRRNMNLNRKSRVESRAQRREALLVSLTFVFRRSPLDLRLSSPAPYRLPGRRVRRSLVGERTLRFIGRAYCSRIRGCHFDQCRFRAAITAESCIGRGGRAPVTRRHGLVNE